MVHIESKKVDSTVLFVSLVPKFIETFFSHCTYEYFTHLLRVFEVFMRLEMRDMLLGYKTAL